MRNMPAFLALANILGFVLACEQEPTARRARAEKEGADVPPAAVTEGDAEAASGETKTKSRKKKPSGGDGGEQETSADADDDEARSGDGDGDGGEELPAEKKRVTFPGSRGDQVPGYLWLPKRRAGERHPTVLLMYGIKGNKDDGNIARAAEILGAEGFVSLTIDWPGTGERGSIGNMDRITNAGGVKDWTVGDYGKAFDYLQGLPEVDGERMGYVGASMGAMTGLAFAAGDGRVKAFTAIVPIPDPLWGGDDPQSTIGRVAPRPLLCIATSDNSDHSADVCGRVGAGGQTKLLPGGHELEGFRDQVVTETKAFLIQHLKP